MNLNQLFENTQGVNEGNGEKDPQYYLRNDIWRIMDGDDLVHEYTPERYEVVGAKKLLARFDDEGYDVTHVISPMGTVTYLYGKPMHEGFDGEYDDEAGMAHSNLHTIARAAQGLLDTIDDQENLPEWVQEKIAKVEGMMVSAWDYLQSQEEQGIDPRQDLDELSPQTLASYVRKSNTDARDRLRQDPNNQFKKAQKRAAGMGQAIGKIRATMEPGAKQQGVAEGEEHSPVAGAITRRIMSQRLDLLKKYGPANVAAAIDDVAEFVGDTEEIGSSDVSGWVLQVERALNRMGQGLGEAGRSKYHANTTGFARGARDPEGQDPAPDTRTWYIRLNGKLIKDKQGMPYSFRGKAAANKAAVNMQAKLFNQGKEFVLTTNPNDPQQGVAEQKKNSKASAVTEGGLRDQSLNALMQARQAIQQQQAAEIDSWKQDFEKNTAAKFTAKPTTPPAPVAQPGESHSALRARLNMLDAAIKKQQQLDALGVRAEKLGLLNEPGIQADLDTSMYVKDAARDNYATLNKHLDTVIARVSNRITQRQAVRKKPQAMAEDAGSVEAWGYAYNRRDQRVMWRQTFASESAAQAWADQHNATILGMRPVQQDVAEASSPAQQAAIAINMKKHHKKPKNKGVTEGLAQDEAEEYSGWRAEFVNEINFNTFEVKMTNTRSKESGNFIVRPVDMISHGPTLAIETMDVHDLQTGRTESWTSDDPQPDGGIVYAISGMFYDNKQLQKKLWNIVDNHPGGEDHMPGLDQRRSIGQEVDADDYINSQEKTQAAMAKMKKGMVESLLDELYPGDNGFGPFKVYVGNNFIEKFATFDEAKEEIEFLWNADPRSSNDDWKIIDGTGKTVWQHDPGAAYDEYRMRHKIQFNKPDDLKEFAPGGEGGSDSGRWYTDDELADIIGDDWFEDFDVSHDEFNIDTHGEKAKQNLASYANSWFDDKGYNVNVMGVEHNDVDHDLKWYIVGSFHNPRFAEQGVAEAWSQKYKSSINCSHPKGFSQRAHCAGKKKHNESVEMEMTCPDCGMCETHGDHSQQSLDEACWKGYHKEGMKTMFGKRYPNCVKNKNESLETYIRKGECPGCGGDMVAEGQLNEKQDACYHKVKSRYKVWPSAYASGALVQCRKKGAANWGNSNESITQEEYDQLDENLKKWFSDKWVRFGPDGKIRGDCARGDDSEGKPKCLPQSQAHSLGKKGRASAAARKRRQDPNPERSGAAINVNTKKKSNEGMTNGSDKKEATFRIQKMLNKKFGANLDVDGIMGPLTLQSINKFMPDAAAGVADQPNRTTAVQGKKIKEESRGRRVTRSGPNETAVKEQN